MALANQKLSASAMLFVVLLNVSCRRGKGGRECVGLPIGEIARTAVPAVLLLRPEGGMAQGSGAGFLVRGQGGDLLVVTNQHVVWGASSMTVQAADGSLETADVIGTDSAVDLAVLRLRNPKNEMKTLSFANDSVGRIGDHLVLIGSPGGVLDAVTVGILSARGRVPHGTHAAEFFVDYLFTDAIVGSGNSGGPVLDLNGNVIGVVAAVIGGPGGLGVAIPSRLAERVVNALERDGECPHAFAGLRVVEERLEGHPGALKVVWTDGSAGEPGEIMQDDHILSVDGTRVSTASEFEWREFMAKPGEKWSLETKRKERITQVTVVLQALTQDTFLNRLGASLRGRFE